MLSTNTHALSKFRVGTLENLVGNQGWGAGAACFGPLEPEPLEKKIIAVAEAAQKKNSCTGS